MTTPSASHRPTRGPFDRPPLVGSARLPGALALGAPLALLVGCALLFGASVKQPNTLSASWSIRIDSDTDGLTDAQEALLGTSPDAFDTDGDGFSDLEEIARRSDPLHPGGTPVLDTVDLGMFSSYSDGMVSMNAAVYVPQGRLMETGFYLGAVLDGRPILIPGPAVAAASRKFLFRAANGGHLLVVEVPVPDWMVHAMGQLSFFAGAALGDPLDPNTQRSIEVTTLASVAGIIASVEEAPPDLLEGEEDDPGEAGGGVVYRPLADDDEIPSSLSSGQVCYQVTSPAGTNGANIVYEVNSADCVPMDSYCSGADCSASVGKVLELPDPGSLLGG